MSKTIHDKFKEMLERKKKLEEELNRSLPPRYVMDYINKKTEDTYTLNKGNLDKSSFRLGMYTMWSFVYKNRMLKPQKHE